MKELTDKHLNLTERNAVQKNHSANQNVRKQRGPKDPILIGFGARNPKRFPLEISTRIHIKPNRRYIQLSNTKSEGDSTESNEFR